MENKNLAAVSVFLLAFIIASSVVVIRHNDANTANVIDSIKSFFNTDTGGSTTGNGAPSGTHYNLNIIGVAKDKSADMTGGDGHRIFVTLGGNKPADPVRTKILLSQSTDGSFQVLDANGTDGQASFKLPAPGTYSIWARPLGKPGGESKITTCSIDPLTLEEVCSTSNEVFLRNGGKSSFRDVTTTLTTIDIDSSLTDVITACGATTVSLFDPCLEGYFWAYDNNGLKLLQLRFYPVVSSL
ncbi:hypothetical protein KW785_01200 [Candidatus Parcubacteria bacterium]|nr:hypothetical protein [Candidatus Parcubacteria bacterium]